MFRAFSAVLVAAALLCANGQEPVFRASSELVVVDVQVVRTKTGTPAPALHAGDFEISEENVRQEIVHFSRDEFPLSVVLLFDLTDSVRPVLRRLADGAKTALAHLKASDEVAVMVYAGHARVVEWFTTDRSRTERAIERAAQMESREPAFFNEAIYSAARALRQTGNPTNRRVIIWLTDNLPNLPPSNNKSVHSEDEAVRALQEEGVVVAPILLTSPLWMTLGPMVRVGEAAKGKARAPGDAHKYAEWTGGKVVGLRGREPGERLAELIDELHARYTIAYRPSDPQPAGTFRKIQVHLVPSQSLRVKEWTVTARQGYYRK